MIQQLMTLNLTDLEESEFKARLYNETRDKVISRPCF